MQKFSTALLPTYSAVTHLPLLLIAIAWILMQSIALKKLHGWHVACIQSACHDNGVTGS